MNATTRFALGTALLAAAAGGIAAAAAAQEAGPAPAPAAPKEDPNAELVKSLGSADFEARSKAYEALRAAGKDAAAALRAGASSDDAEVRWSCRRLLRHLDGGEEGGRRPMVLRFGEDPAPTERTWPEIRGAIDEDAFRQSLESLRERMGELERDLGERTRTLESRDILLDAQGLNNSTLRILGGKGTVHVVTEKDGERTEVERGEDGRVKVTLTRRGEDGQPKTENFEAESMEALAKAHPDAHAKVKEILGDGLHFFPGGMRFETPGFGALRGRDALVPHLAPVPRPVLGVGVSPVPPVLRTQMEIPEDEGIVVEEVREGSLAARLSLQRHDVLLRVNGIPVSTAADIRGSVEAVKEGGEVRLEVLRAGKRIALTGTR